MIEKKILLGYSSPHGSTLEIARFLQGEFRNRDIPTDVSPFERILNIEPYLGLILMAPIQGMRWDQSAVEFFQNHRHQYGGRVVALLATSYLVKVGRPNLKERLTNFFKTQPHLQPHDLSHTFGGRVNAPLPWLARLMFGVPKEAPLDVIDWDEIRSWAGMFLEKFEQKAEFHARVRRGGYDA